MIVRIKRQKYFSDNPNPNNPNQEKKGMGTGTKLLIGAATTAGLFAGARRGMLGARAQMASNRLWARGGQMFGSQGMVDSARNKYSQGLVKKRIKSGMDGYKDITVGSEQFNSLVKKQENKLTTAGNSQFKNDFSMFGNVNRQTAPVNAPAVSATPATPPPTPKKKTYVGYQPMKETTNANVRNIAQLMHY